MKKKRNFVTKLYLKKNSMDLIEIYLFFKMNFVIDFIYLWRVVIGNCIIPNNQFTSACNAYRFHKSSVFSECIYILEF